MKAMLLLTLLTVIGCSRVEDSAPKPIVITKAQIDLGESAPVFEKGAKMPSSRWICTLLGERKEDPGTPLLADANKPIEFRDGGTLLGSGIIRGGSIDRNHKRSLSIDMQSQQAAAKFYRDLGIWPRPGQDDLLPVAK